MSVGARSIARICGNLGPGAVSMSASARMLDAPKGLERCGWRKNFENFPQNRPAGASRRLGGQCRPYSCVITGGSRPTLHRPPTPHGQGYLPMPPIAAGSPRASVLAHATHRRGLPAGEGACPCHRPGGDGDEACAVRSFYRPAGAWVLGVDCFPGARAPGYRPRPLQGR